MKCTPGTSMHRVVWETLWLAFLGMRCLGYQQSSAPGMVGQITTTMKNPETIILRWEAPTFPNGPLSSMRYVVQWHNQEMNESEKEQNGLVKESVELKKADGIQGGHTFIYKVFAYQENRNKSGPTRSITRTQYQYPEKIVRLPSDEGSLRVQWTSPSDDSIEKHVVAYREVGSDLSGRSPVHPTKKSTTYNETFSDLKAESKYAFWIEAYYVNGGGRFVWPLRGEEPVFGTGEDRPGRPDPPKVVEFDKYKNVTWKLSDNGGLPIITYELYVKNYSDGLDYLVYNNTRTSWTVQNLVQGNSYTFKVRALNKIGFGDFSLESTPFDPPVTAPATQPPENRQWIIILAAFIGVVILVIAAIIACFMMRKMQPRRVPASSRPVNSELATLRELPNGTVHTTNTLYAINIVLSEEDIAGLPHFPRDHLRLTKFLGSGAFGEVFEGVALDILGSNTGETNVAVKTLQKGATDQEKEEFLKEALLMGNFKHKHILGILGVCIRDDPQFIIMELMECGDLLSYLRQSRSTPVTDGNLTIGEMVTVCAQVADGCKYMESMHFVHRDLAARNCLVCYRNGERLVKIGDFGLARDIYRSDYYRKEGQGLLPVRWMSPESLIDGVFTTQSDVWAYGVLVWEVLTLGQQPYPARTNIEVLRYVRAQGTLDRPRNCPDDLYSLMLRCWEYEPDRRPSFCKIHQDLLELQGRDLEAEMKAAAQAPVDYARIASEEEEPLTRSPPVQPPDQQPEQNSRATTNVRKENGGYMQPVGPPKTPLPEYLELIPDDVPIQDSTDMNIHGKNEPKYIPRQTSNPGHKLNYAHLAASSDYESDDSGSDGVNVDRSGDRCDRFSSQNPVLNYADLSSSATRGQGVPSSNPSLHSYTGAGVEMDTDNPYLRNVLAPNQTKSLPTTQPSSGSSLNYASLPSAYPDSSIDTDNPYAVSAFDKNRACSMNSRPQNNHHNKNNLNNDHVINYAVLPGNSFSDGDMDTDNPYVAGLDTPGPANQQNRNSRWKNHKVPLQKPQRVALPQNSVNYASLNGGNPDRNVMSALVTLDRQRESNV